MGIVVRSENDPMNLTGSIRDVLMSIDSDQPVFDMMTLEDRLSNSLGRRRINSLLVGTFALLALLLAFIGIYSVLSYTVSQRTHEIGIRMALGARERGVLWMIVRQAMGMCLIGLLFGIGVALATTRLISSLLYGVQTTDAATFFAASIFVISAALIASYIPARKATAVDPMKSLRYE